MFLGRDGFYWWIGVVEENVDPLLLGRVKVRIFGYHSSYEQKATGIDTPDLPWANILVAPNAQGTYARIGLGEWVAGFFMDGPDAQEPVVMGIIPTPLKSDPTGKSFGKYTSSKRSFPHVTTSDKDYPPNLSADNDYQSLLQQVAIASESGHTIQLKDFVNEDKIRLTHSNGKVYLEISKSEIFIGSDSGKVFLRVTDSEIIAGSPSYGSWNLTDQLNWISYQTHNTTGGSKRGPRSFTIGNRAPPPPPPPPRRGRKIICTKLYELGFLPEYIYIADREFGNILEKERPDIYYGYVAWAETVVDWMEGNGPQCMFWIRDDEKRKHAQMHLSTKWAKEIATPWAKHMAYLMGVEKEKNLTGRVLAFVGTPICKVIGVAQRWFGQSNRPDGLIKGFALWGIFALLRFIVWIFERKK